MDDKTREALKEEAIRSLRACLATGQDGFRVKGIDRLHALGIDTAACEAAGRPGIEHLIRHVVAYC